MRELVAHVVDEHLLGLLVDLLDLRRGTACDDPLHVRAVAILGGPASVVVLHEDEMGLVPLQLLLAGIGDAALVVPDRSDERHA